ncbi:MAG: hypothetical protein IIX13_07725 [Bacteroidales bacterium]|nr:hypothetical protein [Bacteroidales bacterium]
MKTKLLTLYILSSLMASITLLSCRGNEGGEEEIKPDYNPEISTWYKEFESIKNTGTFGLCWGYSMRIPELKLNDYTYKGVYDTHEKVAQLREAIFSDNTYVPVYRDNWEVFALETWDQIKETDVHNINRERTTLFIDSLLKTAPEVVELHWTYNNNLSFTTHALVTPFKINYDNILGNLIYISVKSANTSDLKRNVALTKSSSENDNDDDVENMKKNVSYKETHTLNVRLSNYNHNLSVSCTLKGELQDNENEPFYGEYLVKSREYKIDNNNYTGSRYYTYAGYHQKSFYDGVSGSVSYDYTLCIADKEQDTNQDGKIDGEDLPPSVHYGVSGYTYTGYFREKSEGSSLITASMLE